MTMMTMMMMKTRKGKIWKTFEDLDEDGNLDVDSHNASDNE